MADYEIDPRPYFQILHMMLRHDDADRADDYPDRVMDWMMDHQAVIERVFSKGEYRIIQLVYGFWDKHKVSPSRDAVEDMARQKMQHQVLLDVLTEYDQHEEDLKEIDPKDLNTQLDIRISQYEKRKLVKVFTNAIEVTINAVNLNDREKTLLTGPRDAINYVIGRVQQGILVDDLPSTGGNVEEIADEIRYNYSINKRDRQYGQLFIKTGLQMIDGHMGGLRRKELNGILGYTGQRKTCMARTIGYNAAKAGLHVLHIPLETDVDEENNAYAVIHAQHICTRRDNGYSKTRLEQALFTKEEEDYFFNTVVTNYKEAIGKNLTIYSPDMSRSWADVKAIIERENYKQKVDLVIIDYLTMLSTPGARDEKADKIAIVQEAKKLALTANQGTGLCILTPIQGSRKGYEDAQAHDGVWTTAGIYMYSELDKSLDNCFYVYLDDALNLQHMIKVGSCKTRRASNIPPILVPVNDNSGALNDHDEPQEVQMEETSSQNNDAANNSGVLVQGLTRLAQ
jgi:hypothetical protein